MKFKIHSIKNRLDETGQFDLFDDYMLKVNKNEMKGRQCLVSVKNIFVNKKPEK